MDLPPLFGLSGSSERLGGGCGTCMLKSVGKVCNQNSGTTRFNERSGDLEVTGRRSARKNVLILVVKR